jgi:hypothetical protein
MGTASVVKRYQAEVFFGWDHYIHKWWAMDIIYHIEIRNVVMFINA